MIKQNIPRIINNLDWCAESRSINHQQQKSNSGMIVVAELSFLIEAEETLLGHGKLIVLLIMLDILHMFAN